jgi:hypothetical protein
MGRPDSGHGVDVHFAIALPNRTTLPAAREAGLVQIANSLTEPCGQKTFQISGFWRQMTSDSQISLSNRCQLVWVSK